MSGVLARSLGSTISACYSAGQTAATGSSAIEPSKYRNCAEPTDWLVGHRGWPDQFPENSLEGVQAALEAGARFVEFDVQVTADRHAVVVHDDNLERLTGKPRRVTASTLGQLEALHIKGPRGSQASIPTLSQMLDLVTRYPQATAFVELKRDSIRRHGLQAAMDCVLPQLQSTQSRVVFISFSWRAVRRAQNNSALPTGWVFRPWSVVARIMAGWLKPDYLFVRADRVPNRARPFWPGAWRWVIYKVGNPDQALALRDRGADLIEVDDLPGQLKILKSRQGIAS